ncbi:MAG: hypothetical protein WC655_05330, partial [Candidatus Hydrogenedentales bacterium]
MMGLLNRILRPHYFVLFIGLIVSSCFVSSPMDTLVFDSKTDPSGSCRAEVFQVRGGLAVSPHRTTDVRIGFGANFEDSKTHVLVVDGTVYIALTWTDADNLDVCILKRDFEESDISKSVAKW